MTQFDMVHEFHRVYDCNISPTPVLPNKDERALRIALLQEEYREYIQAEKDNDLVEIADALADMLYIINGTCVSYGIPIDEIFAEVHASNMSKLDENGKVIRRDDCKVLKGPNFFKPKIKEIMEKHESDIQSETK
jgi:predicted HAD superfamily Cof-like phosphohydrolase